jgi:hypothetical protein
MLNCSTASQLFNLDIFWPLVEYAIHRPRARGYLFEKERGLIRTAADSVEQAAIFVYLVRSSRRRSGSRKNYAPQRVTPDASQARSQISDALANCNVNVSSV